MTPGLPLDRFLDTLNIVAREGQHLAYSREKLFNEHIDAAWVAALAEAPELAERLEAFVSRYSRMQDTIADKLIPRWLLALAERPASQLETLNRAERLGVIDSVEAWLAARNLRNQLVHEYVLDAAVFAQSILLAKGYSAVLLQTYNRLRRDSIDRMGVSENRLPPALPVAEV